MFGFVTLFSDDYLQDKRFTLLLDSAEIERIIATLDLSSRPFTLDMAKLATGALVDTNINPDPEIWLTISPEPFDLSASFVRIDDGGRE